jgi:disulfide bond formation protein DsbB
MKATRPVFILTVLKMPTAGLLIAAVALLALTFAFIMQYGFDLQPCVLCLWQRVPFGLSILLALCAVVWRPYRNHTAVLLTLCAVIFFIGAILAIFHTGVELHWWLGTSGCAIEPLHGTSKEDLRTELLHTVVARCDQIAWTFLGLSMANWNVPFSLGLAGFSLAAAVRK